MSILRGLCICGHSEYFKGVVIFVGLSSSYVLGGFSLEGAIALL